MLYPDINYLAVLAAAVAAYLIGALWYGVLFGKQWATLVGKKTEELGKPGITMPISALIHLLMAFAMAFIIGWSGAQGPVGGVMAALFVGIVLVLPVIALNDVYEGRSLKLYLITAGHQLLAIVIMGLVIGLF